MRRSKDGTPDVVHRRCEWAQDIEVPPYTHRCTANAEPGSPHCYRHQTATPNK